MYPLAALDIAATGAQSTVLRLFTLSYGWLLLWTVSVLLGAIFQEVKGRDFPSNG
jgi:hypothetical protein